MIATRALIDGDVKYTPHPRQEAFHRAVQPWRWLCAGYGTGKTTGTVVEAFQHAVVTHPGYSGIVVAPTYPLLFQSWMEVWANTIPRGWWQLKRDPLYGPHIYLPAVRSKIWLRSSSNPGRLEGINAAWMIFDEASREPRREPMNVLVGRVRAGYPGRQLSVMVSGPPATRSHWTAEMFGTGSGPKYQGDAWQWGNDTTAVIRARTRDNPNLPPDYEKRLRNAPGATRAWCAQWLDAQFGSVEGQVYDRFSRDVHVIPAAKLAGRAWRRVIAGVDWGYSHHGVMVPVAQDGLGDCYLLRDEAHQGLLVESSPGQWGPIAARLVRDDKVTEFHCDPSRPDLLRALAKALATEKVSARVYPADNDVGNGLRRVAALLENAVERAALPSGSKPERMKPALYVSDAAAFTIGEAESYVRKRLRDGTFAEDPEKKNDHAMDALRYAVAQLAGSV